MNGLTRNSLPNDGDSLVGGEVNYTTFSKEHLLLDLLNCHHGLMVGWLHGGYLEEPLGMEQQYSNLGACYQMVNLCKFYGWKWLRR